MNLNRVHPLLLAWADHYVHLREVTTADIITATRPLPASRRRQTLTALRSLFGHCKKAGTIFRDPTRGVRDDPRPLNLLQPLQPGDISQAPRSWCQSRPVRASRDISIPSTTPARPIVTSATSLAKPFRDSAIAADTPGRRRSPTTCDRAKPRATAR